jgi:hypothetical protein
VKLNKMCGINNEPQTSLNETEEMLWE